MAKFKLSHIMDLEKILLDSKSSLLILKKFGNFCPKAHVIPITVNDELVLHCMPVEINKIFSGFIQDLNDIQHC